jgi:hypothetical protein
MRRLLNSIDRAISTSLRQEQRPAGSGCYPRPPRAGDGSYPSPPPAGNGCYPSPPWSAMVATRAISPRLKAR